MRSHLRNVLAGALALAVLVAPTAAVGSPSVGASAPPERLERPFTGFYYGDFDAEILLLAGAPFGAGYCAEENAPVVTKSYRQKRDGTWVERWRSRQRLNLYRTPLGGPEYDEQQCAAIEAGGDAEEPFAVGRGRVRSLVDGLAAPDGPPVPGARIVNRSSGLVEDDWGSHYVVLAQADLVLDENLNPVGSPTEFQSLRVIPIGPRFWR